MLNRDHKLDHSRDQECYFMIVSDGVKMRY